MEKNKLELEDTSELMVNNDHRARLLAEYLQLDIRMNGLEAMMYKWDEAIRKGIEAREVLGFEPSTSFEILYEQLVHMRG